MLRADGGVEDARSRCPSDDVKRHLHQVLAEVANEEFVDTAWCIDDHMRNIPDHYHAHARPPYFWRRH